MLKTFHALAALAVVVAALGVTARAEIIEQIIVKVNGEILTKTEFEQRQVQAIRQSKTAVASEDDLKKAIANVTPQLILDTVDELILIQRGKELGYKLDDAQYENIVKQIRKDNKLDDDEKFAQALKSEGMSEADLRRSLEKQMIISRVQGAEVMQKVAITEDEARKYHAEHQDQFTTPGTVTLREIFVALPASEQGVNVAAEEETKAKVEALRARVLAGESFETVAAAESTAPSKANGGLIGPLNQAELAPALQTLLEKMKPGDVSEPLRTAKGYQLLKLDAVTPAKVLTAEEAHDKIADRLYDQKRVAEMKKYLVKLRSQAIIEWKNDELKKAYESAAGTPAPAAAPAADPAAPATPAAPPSTR
jgi:parvulin-like peptidyl-prolyl isomerase